MGKASFDAIHEMDDDPDFYKDALGTCYAIPSVETLRQRLDLIGGSVRRQILDENIHMLKINGIGSGSAVLFPAMHRIPAYNILVQFCGRIIKKLKKTLAILFVL